MSENKLVKYKGNELERIGNAITITNKLLSLVKSLPDLIIEETSTSPYVNLNASTGIFLISGKSVPIHSYEFYSGLYDWIDKFYDISKNNIKFKFHLELVSGDSSKMIQALIKRTYTKANERSIACSVDWYFAINDDYILELGEHLKKYLKVTVNLIPAGNPTWGKNWKEPENNMQKKLKTTMSKPSLPLQGTFSIRTMPSLRPKMPKEPSSPSRGRTLWFVRSVPNSQYTS